MWVENTKDKEAESNVNKVKGNEMELVKFVLCEAPLKRFDSAESYVANVGSHIEDNSKRKISLQRNISQERKHILGHHNLIKYIVIFLSPNLVN